MPPKPCTRFHRLPDRRIHWNHTYWMNLLGTTRTFWVTLLLAQPSGFSYFFLFESWHFTTFTPMARGEEVRPFWLILLMIMRWGIFTTYFLNPTFDEAKTGQRSTERDLSFPSRSLFDLSNENSSWWVGVSHRQARPPLFILSWMNKIHSLVG